MSGWTASLGAACYPIIRFLESVGMNLVQSLPDGPLDLIGDVHGEIDALEALLTRLGYNARGDHPQKRRLVFLGDLVDRGPDSPAVLDRVQELVARGRAQSILGNHELNIMLGSRKVGNGWFHNEPEPLDRSNIIIPQRGLHDAPSRARALAFFRALPIVLERSDLRLVHACWHSDHLVRIRGERDALALCRQYAQDIDRALDREGVGDQRLRKLARQNRNPIKTLTSGLEERRTAPVEIGVRHHWESRVAWWLHYRDPIMVVFGHYWRQPVHGDHDSLHLFGNVGPNARLGRGWAMCLDYSVGKRYRERQPGASVLHTSLAALRWPERTLIFDNRAAAPLE
jgi:hypothetical protein